MISMRADRLGVAETNFAAQSSQLLNVASKTWGTHTCHSTAMTTQLGTPVTVLNCTRSRNSSNLLLFMLCLFV